MTTITRTTGKITCEGHAGNRTCCAMLTAIIGSLAVNVSSLSLKAEYEISEGHFEIDFSKLSENDMLYIEYFWRAVCSLRDSYPENFSILFSES